MDYSKWAGFCVHDSDEQVKQARPDYALKTSPLSCPKIFCRTRVTPPLDIGYVEPRFVISVPVLDIFVFVLILMTQI